MQPTPDAPRPWAAQEGELAAVQAANAWAHSFPPLGLAAQGLSHGALPALIFLGLFAWSLLRRGGQALRALLAAAAAFALCDPLNHYLLKAAFARPRPCHVEPALETLVRCGAGLSFPSSHAANGVAVALALTLAARLPRRAALAVLSLGLLVGASRVFVGVHYPSDVAAGWAVGGLIGAGVGLGFRRWGAAPVARP